MGRQRGLFFELTAHHRLSKIYVADLSLRWSEPLSIETTIKSIRSKLIDKRDQNAVTILHSIIPEEAELGEVIKVGAAEDEEVIWREVIRDGGDEESGGARARAYEGVGGGGAVAEEVDYAFQFGYIGE